MNSAALQAQLQGQPRVLQCKSNYDITLFNRNHTYDTLNELHLRFGSLQDAQDIQSKVLDESSQEIQ